MTVATRLGVFSKIFFFAFVAIALSITQSGCGGNLPRENKIDYPVRFHLFIKQLPWIQIPLQLESEQNHSEYINRPGESDSSWFSDREYVVGLLRDTSEFYEVMYLTTGDDLYPSVKVFSKDGRLIADNILGYSDCAGADCSMINCTSYVRIDENGLSRGISYDEIECGTPAVKNFVKHFEQKESIEFDSSGNFVTQIIIE